MRSYKSARKHAPNGYSMRIQEIQIPKCLAEIDKFESILLEENMSSDENIKFIIDFMDKHIKIGITTFIYSFEHRYHLLGEFMEIFHKFPSALRYLIAEKMQDNSLFVLLLNEDEQKKIKYYFPDSDLSIPHDYFVSRVRINTTEKYKFDRAVANALIHDDFDYVSNLSINESYSFDTCYDTEKFFSANLNIVTLASLFGAVKIFKFCYLNVDHEKSPLDILEYAVKGGNIEIIRLLTNNNDKLNIDITTCLKYRRYEISDWISDGVYNFSQFPTCNFSARLIAASINAGFKFDFIRELILFHNENFESAALALVPILSFGSYFNFFKLVEDQNLIDELIKCSPRSVAEFFEKIQTKLFESKAKMIIESPYFNFDLLSLPLVFKIQSTFPSLIPYISKCIQEKGGVDYYFNSILKLQSKLIKNDKFYYMKSIQSEYCYPLLIKLRDAKIDITNIISISTFYLSLTKSQLYEFKNNIQTSDFSLILCERNDLDINDLEFLLQPSIIKLLISKKCDVLFDKLFQVKGALSTIRPSAIVNIIIHCRESLPTQEMVQQLIENQYLPADFRYPQPKSINKYILNSDKFINNTSFKNFLDELGLNYNHFYLCKRVFTKDDLNQLSTLFMQCHNSAKDNAIISIFNTVIHRPEYRHSFQIQMLPTCLCMEMASNCVLTPNELEILQDKPGVLPSLLKNHENAKHVSNETIINKLTDNNLLNALKNRNLSLEDVDLLTKFHFNEKRFERILLTIPFVLQNVSTDVLVNAIKYQKPYSLWKSNTNNSLLSFFFDKLSLTILEKLFKRKDFDESYQQTVLNMADYKDTDVIAIFLENIDKISLNSQIRIAARTGIDCIFKTEGEIISETINDFIKLQQFDLFKCLMKKFRIKKESLEQCVYNIAKSNKIDLVKLFIDETKFDINSTLRSKRTNLLYISFESLDSDLLNFLLSRNVSTKFSIRFTPLYYAISLYPFPLIEKKIEALLDVCDIRYEEQFYSIVSFLSSKNAKQHLIDYAISKGAMSKLDAIPFKHRADLKLFSFKIPEKIQSCTTNQLLYILNNPIRFHSGEIIDELLTRELSEVQAYVYFTSDNFFIDPQKQASFPKYVKLFYSCLKDVDIIEPDTTPTCLALNFALSKKSNNIAKKLIEKYNVDFLAAEKDFRYTSPASICIKKHNKEMLLFLIEHGLDLNRITTNSAVKSDRKMPFKNLFIEVLDAKWLEGLDIILQNGFSLVSPFDFSYVDFVKSVQYGSDILMKYVSEDEKIKLRHIEDKPLDLSFQYNLETPKNDDDNQVSHYNDNTDGKIKSKHVLNNKTTMNTFSNKSEQEDVYIKRKQFPNQFGSTKKWSLKQATTTWTSGGRILKN